MPPKSTVFIFQDDDRLLQDMEADLESEGHIIIGVAKDVQAAQILLQDLAADGIEPDVALIDNMGFASETSFRPLPYGAFITQEVRNRFPDAIVVGTTGGLDIYGDVVFDTGKPVDGRLGAFVTALPYKER